MAVRVLDLLLNAENRGLRRGLRESDQDIDNFVQRAGRRLDQFGRRSTQILGRVAAGAIALGTAFTVAGGRTVLELQRMARAAGLPVAEFQVLERAWRSLGESGEQLVDRLADLRQRQAQAVTGDQNLLAYFRQLGVEFQDLQTSGVDDLFLRIGRHIATSTDRERDFVAVAAVAGEETRKVFESWARISDETARARRIIQATGITITDDVADKLRDVENLVVDLGRAIQINLVLGLAQGLGQTVDTARQQEQLLRDVAQGARDLGENIGELILVMRDWEERFSAVSFLATALVSVLGVGLIVRIVTLGRTITTALLAPFRLLQRALDRGHGRLTRIGVAVGDSTRVIGLGSNTILRAAGAWGALAAAIIAATTAAIDAARNPPPADLFGTRPTARGRRPIRGPRQVGEDATSDGTRDSVRITAFFDRFFSEFSRRANFVELITPPLRRGAPAATQASLAGAIPDPFNISSIDTGIRGRIDSFIQTGLEIRLRELDEAVAADERSFAELDLQLQSTEAIVQRSREEIESETQARFKLAALIADNAASSLATSIGLPRGEEIRPDLTQVEVTSFFDELRADIEAGLRTTGPIIAGRFGQTITDAFLALDFSNLGQSLGRIFLQTILDQIIGQLVGRLLSAALPGLFPTGHTGYIFPGGPNQESPVVGLGGEVILTRDAQMRLIRGEIDRGRDRGGNTIYLTLNGDVSQRQVRSTVRALRREIAVDTVRYIQDNRLQR